MLFADILGKQGVWAEITRSALMLQEVKLLRVIQWINQVR